MDKQQPDFDRADIHRRVQAAPPQWLANPDQVMASTIDNGTRRVWLGIFINFTPLIYALELEQAQALHTQLGEAIAKHKTASH